MKRLACLSTTCVLLGTAACPDKGTGPRGGASVKLAISEQIEVNDRTSPAERLSGLDRRSVLKLVREKLTRSAEVELVSKRGDRTYRMKVDFGVGRRSSGDDELPPKLVLVAVRAAPPEQAERVVLEASAALPVPEEVSESKQVARVKEVVGSVLDDILFQAGLARGPEKKVIRAFAEKDVNRLAAAVDIAAVRRIKSAVPGLTKLLKHKDERIADRAIGALVAIGDRRAIKPLTRLSKFENTEKMAKILDAIGTLGGKEAEEYLDFVSSGHEDADIRNLAAEALSRLRKSKEKGKKGEFGHQ
jgi:hypothetical protein